MDGARICIDFGSSFTKVALRAGWDQRTLFLEDRAILDPLQRICVPSTVCEIKTGGSSNWVCGKKAMQMSPSADVVLHRNWKSQFIKPEDSPPPSRLAAAGKFFEWLRQEVARHQSFAEFVDAPVRVCLPDFKILGQWKGYFGQLLIQAGWNCQDSEFLENEPYTNMLGVLTCGRNATHVWQNERNLTMDEMFDRSGGLLYAKRRALLTDKPKDFGVMIVDVGAYTTDFAYLYFPDASEFDPPDPVTESQVLGIRELDAELESAFGPVHAQQIRGLSTEEFEKMRRALLIGDTYALPSGGMLGIREHQPLVAEAVQRFARRVIGCLDEFQSAKTQRLDLAILSGGGSLISGIGGAVRLHLEGKGVRVQDYGDGLFKSGDGTAEDQRIRNAPLVRGASAIGGCSVYVDLLPRRKY